MGGRRGRAQARSGLRRSRSGRCASAARRHSKDRARARLLSLPWQLGRDAVDPYPSLCRRLLRLQEEELKKLGLDANQAYRLETAETAAAQYKKKEKKPAPSGWCVSAGRHLIVMARLGVCGGLGRKQAMRAPPAVAERRRVPAPGSCHCREQFNQATLAAAYEKRTEKIKPDRAEYEAAKVCLRRGVWF